MDELQNEPIDAPYRLVARLDEVLQFQAIASGLLGVMLLEEARAKAMFLLIQLPKVRGPARWVEGLLAVTQGCHGQDVVVVLQGTRA